MEFILMQSLDLIYTKNLFVRKNVANKIATIGGLLTARYDRAGLEASNKKNLGASFFCFEKYPQELYRLVWRLANGVLWQMTRVPRSLQVCLGKISCKFLYSKQKAAKSAGSCTSNYGDFSKGTSWWAMSELGKKGDRLLHTSSAFHLPGASQYPRDKTRKISSSQQELPRG